MKFVLRISLGDGRFAYRSRENPGHYTDNLAGAFLYTSRRRAEAECVIGWEELVTCNL